MDICLDQKCDIPIFEQIFMQIMMQILSGTLSVDDSLPSVRNAADMFQVNCSTVARAYDLLKTKGYVYTIPAKGYYIAEVPREAMQADFMKIEKCFVKIEEIAASYNLSLNEVLIWFQEKQ